MIYVRKTEWGYLVEEKQPGDTVATVRSGYLPTRRDADARAFRLREEARTAARASTSKESRS